MVDGVMDLDTAKRKAPGVAVLCSLVAPFFGFIVAGMALMGVKIRSYVAGPLVVWSLFSIALAAVLLARRRGAHWVAVGLVLFGFVFSEVVTSPDEPTGILKRKGSSSSGNITRQARKIVDGRRHQEGPTQPRYPIVLLLTAGGLAFWRRDAFVRLWDWPRFTRDMVAGAKAMLRHRPGAAGRALGGIALCLFGFFVVGTMMGGKSVSGGFTGFGSVIAGVLLLVSAIRLPEE